MICVVTRQYSFKFKLRKIENKYLTVIQKSNSYRIETFHQYLCKLLFTIHNYFKKD